MTSIPKRARLRRAERNRASRAALIERLCAALAEGHSLRAAAARAGMAFKNARRVFAENANVREAYEQARALRAELVADDAVALADRLADSSHAGLKLRIDVRKWRAALGARAERKPPEKNAAVQEQAERLQRALERTKNREEEDMKNLRAMVEAEFTARDTAANGAGGGGDDAASNT